MNKSLEFNNYLIFGKYFKNQWVFFKGQVKIYLSTQVFICF